MRVDGTFWGPARIAGVEVRGGALWLLRVVVQPAAGAGRLFLFGGIGGAMFLEDVLTEGLAEGLLDGGGKCLAAL